MIFRVASHTDNVGPGSIYVAIPGKKLDGTQFISAAITKGATTIVLENDSVTEELQRLCYQKKVCLKIVDNARIALAELSAEAYGFPAKKLKLLGVTGTDGKSTSVYLLFHILKAAGKSVALLSGVEHILGEQAFLASMTTPKPDYIHYFFDQCLKNGIEYVVLELAAQAISYRRIDGLEFDGLIFTNLAHEHGEQYASLDDYFDTKCAILSQKKKNAPLVVHDSLWAVKVKERFPKTLYAGHQKNVDYQVIQLQETFEKQLVELRKNNVWYQLETSLIGAYNASNVAGAFGLACELGISVDAIANGIKSFKGVAGRCERYRLPNNAWAVIDYAHTPQAYENLLPLLKRHARELIVVFGAGGGKDIEKRAKMGKIAAQFAEQIILTNDNPRNDDPEKIMDDIVACLTLHQKAKVFREPDRVQAIMQAYHWSHAGDIIAILGKGHETTQIIGTCSCHHKDSEVVSSL
ncbi:TPA: UDP-N-acetylmuramoyl-L-alanyl-D-glutamate--2,6-diaminopimelate ligase [Candidatus Dependentiae bacterium]|nr:MAG: UDP-N-acetylmuramoyl-L-alanyl-D-glutamate-2,6-diaminopimelate ligase [candidate division TM6 bacterium GW2011_GWF2_36_131]KKQ03549.1 MAG: UDP-N-acetylmuramoyl-L-alanyl-D-glutamate-2,6-diaminopimelate ligase [candidate division TM6 bacterium GW2011_GWE2_36_25]KKQ20176.1 MAG: UDP-N-acetylmuramoyl-L-alanyl-D-glutamate-2,6-diaminopimelate ligase [candidate division TM6 bacterium GW2011_GWA2_36_9]HBR70718.1 UDP-N-acetylmuramoyl-L-alanyl-D-glutamate--2,6-diaminopimelate ligase [Candidatus Depe